MIFSGPGIKTPSKAVDMPAAAAKEATALRVGAAIRRRVRIVTASAKETPVKAAQKNGLLCQALLHTVEFVIFPLYIIGKIDGIEGFSGYLDA